MEILIISKLAPLLNALVVIAGVGGSIKSLFTGKVNTIIWIIISCVILLIFINNPALFIGLVEKLINFAQSIFDAVNTEEVTTTN